MGTLVETSVAAATGSGGLAHAAAQLLSAAEAKKCWACGCLRNTLDAIDRSLPAGSSGSDEVDEAIATARAHLLPQRYECLGCDVCFPALALDGLGAAGLSVAANVCPTETIELRSGWPPLPGAFRVLRFHAPVAVCTLTSDELVDPIATSARELVAIIGSLQTENLGIERLITNVVANPHIRFLVLCGADSRKAIGHLPGQSLVALAHDGIDERRRIVGAKGKRPVLRNLTVEATAHFRATVEVLDLVGTTDQDKILAAINACVQRDPGPAALFEAARPLAPLAGSVPEKMVSDPSGYFVLFLDRARKLLCLEHYANNGLLTTVVEGRFPAELYMTAIESGLLSRLDHAAYLGRELARAESALASGEAYVQDAAPERCSPDCGCQRNAA